MWLCTWIDNQFLSHQTKQKNEAQKHSCVHLMPEPNELRFILDFLHIESALSSRSFLCTGFCPPVFGITCIGSSLFTLDFVHLDFVMSLQGMMCVGLLLLAYGLTCPGSSLSVSDIIQMSFSSPSRSFACSGSILLIYGLSCVGVSLLILDFTFFGLLLLPHGFC